MTFVWEAPSGYTSVSERVKKDHRGARDPRKKARAALSNSLPIKRSNGALVFLNISSADQKKDGYPLRDNGPVFRSQSLKNALLCLYDMYDLSSSKSSLVLTKITDLLTKKKEPTSLKKAVSSQVKPV